MSKNHKITPSLAIFWPETSGAQNGPFGLNEGLNPLEEASVKPSDKINVHLTFHLLKISLFPNLNWGIKLGSMLCIGSSLVFKYKSWFLVVDPLTEGHI